MRWRMQARYVEGAVENLLSTLKWAGLEFDQGALRCFAGPYAVRILTLEGRRSGEGRRRRTVLPVGAEAHLRQIPSTPHRRQSFPFSTLMTFLLTVVQSGKAYHCFCTPTRLAEVRKSLQKSGSNTGYDRHCLALPSEEVTRRLDAGESSIVRFKVRCSFPESQLTR